MTEEIENKIIGAFDVGGKGFDPNELDVDVRASHLRKAGQIAMVNLPPTGTLILNDIHAEEIDEALSLHGWETGSIKWGNGGIQVSVWKENI